MVLVFYKPNSAIDTVAGGAFQEGSDESSVEA